MPSADPVTGSPGPVSRIEAPTVDQRREWRLRLDEPGAHASIARDLVCLEQVELAEPAPPAAVLSGWVRVAAWNVQRGGSPTDMAALIAGSGADVCLLSELDDGMARTANRHSPAEIARHLGAGYAYGVEFVELGLGDAAESRQSSGTNRRGLHGNAVLSRAPLRNALVVRLDDGGRWFSSATDQPRVGGRMAVVATVELDGREVVLASTHLENRTDPQGRADQLERLLYVIDTVHGQAPCVIGGDLNSFGAPVLDLTDPAEVSRLRRQDPTRFSWPVAYEPLFTVAARHGFDWIDANLAAPTTHHHPDGRPPHPPLKIDWLLVRGLEARRPTVVPARGPEGTALSDHELVAASVRLVRPERASGA